MEAVSQGELIRSLVLRLAGLARGGRLDCFIAAVGSDEELDGDTKATVLALARDEAFLLAAEDLCARAPTCTDAGYNAPRAGD